MNDQDTRQALLRAISDEEIRRQVDDLLGVLGDQLVGICQQFTDGEVNPATTYEFENKIAVALRETGRQLAQTHYNALQPEDVKSMPKTMEHEDQRFRRLAGKTPHDDIVTRFGKIRLLRTGYRLGRAGKVIFPLEMVLGVEQGFTPAAVDFVGQQFAATGSSQSRTIEAVQAYFGCSVGVGKLRKLVAWLAESMSLHRESCQIEQLLAWMEQSRTAGHLPVLSVSRDGVSLGIAPFASFEMASVATISVMSAGKRLGTVYLGRAPESNQQTLTDELTSLLRETLRACGDRLPQVAYVTDAGKVETAYWKNVLRKFYVDGKRIKIQRVVDYYHASLRLTIIANAFDFGAQTWRRTQWLQRVRRLLRKRGGWGRVMRSIANMKQLYGYKSSSASEAQDAERYLRRYRRFMNYHALKLQDFPIGSGIVESACKQVVSERLKLSGMRWLHAGAQHVLTLRCLLLSGVWSNAYQKLLESKTPVSVLIKNKAA